MSTAKQQQKEATIHCNYFSSYMEAVVELNNIGAELIDNERYSCAIETLEDAIDIVKKVLIVAHQFEASPKEININEYNRLLDTVERAISRISHRRVNPFSFSDSENASQRSHTHTFFCTEEYQTNALNAKAENVNDNHSFDLFSAKPLRISLKDCVQDEFEDSCVILFNCALAYHRFGDETGVSQLLKKALGLYELSYHTASMMVDNNKTSLSNSTQMKDVQGLFIERAIMSNIRFIYYKEERYDLALDCLNELVRISCLYALNSSQEPACNVSSASAA